MNPEAARAWVRILRDATIVLVGAFILIYQTVAASVPNWRLIAAGITCLVAPPALRWDLRVRRGGENGDD